MTSAQTPRVRFRILGAHKADYRNAPFGPCKVCKQEKYHTYSCRLNISYSGKHAKDLGASK